ncbi:MAG: hypothetical protein IPH20_07580 [Bacteroidales bacterium]|nr:hypothetical protein [Bacteroidales bacterium]
MRSKTPDELVFNSNKVTSAIGDYVYTRNTMEADEKHSSINCAGIIL